MEVKQESSDLTTTALRCYTSMFAILRDLGAEVIEHVDFSDLGGYFKEADLVSTVLRSFPA